MVGRVDELSRLGLWLDRIRHERGCRGALLSGDAGLGKTRLAEEFFRGIAEGAVIGRGVCHAYGERALAPAAEVVRSLLGLREDADRATARASIEAALGSMEASYADHVLQMLDLADGDAPVEELFASTRRLIAACGRDRPVVVFVDDLHWASAPLVDLIEHLLRWLRDAPVLVVATARMEFVESHPTWVDDRDLGVLHVPLAPLSGVETDVLAGSLLGNDTLPPAVLDRVSAAAEGNPLFLEQLLAMLMDEGLLVEDDGRWVLADPGAELPVPPSIHALLSARLDRLGADERGAIERGAVVGRTFTWQAIEALSEQGSTAGVGGHLMGLVRRDLIRPDRSELVGQDAFRFHHVLIRDTAYGAIPKGRRAELHEGYARWLESSSVTGDLDETIGYHLERACVLRRDLGEHDAHTRDLGDRAADLLAGAGRRAARRGQDASAVDLLGRAFRLIGPDDARRPSTSLDLAQAEYAAGAFAEAESHARTVLETHRPDPTLTATASVLVANVRFQLDPDLDLDDMRRQAHELLSAAGSADDRLSQAMAHRLLARVHLWGADTEAMTAAAEAAYRCAAEAGDDRELAECAVVLCWALNLGPERLSSVAERLRELAEAMSGNRRVQAIIWAHMAPTLALLGHPDQGKEWRLRALSQFRDLGLEVQAAIATQSSGGSILAGMAAGKAREAYADVRWAYDVLTWAEERGFLASVTGMLAEAAFDRGSLDEAHALVEQVRALATDDDADAQQRWRMVGAKVAGARGRVEEARRLLDEIESRPPSYPAWRGFAAADRAEILARIGDAAGARSRLEEATRCFADKGVVAGPRIAQVEALIGASA
jgi:tetratricopeptide (TPR) repeat protein